MGRNALRILKASLPSLSFYEISIDKCKDKTGPGSDAQAASMNFTA